MTMSRNFSEQGGGRRETRPLRRAGLQRPAHQVVNAIRVDVLEAEPLVQSERWIEPFDMDRDGLTGRASAVEHFPNERRADTGATAVGHESDVDETDLIAPVIDPEPADCLSVTLDDVPLARRVMLGVMLKLRGKLLIEKRRPLRVVERKLPHLLLASEVVETAHEIVVGLSGRAERDSRWNHAAARTVMTT